MLTILVCSYQTFYIVVAIMILPFLLNQCKCKTNI